MKENIEAAELRAQVSELERIVEAQAVTITELREKVAQRPKCSTCNGTGITPGDTTGEVFRPTRACIDCAQPRQLGRYQTNAIRPSTHFPYASPQPSASVPDGAFSGEDAKGSMQWVEHNDIRDIPDAILTDAGLALKQSQVSGADATTLAEQYTAGYKHGLSQRTSQDYEDATRYRFAAKHCVLGGGVYKFNWPIAPVGKKQFDKYIDAAMQQGGQS